MWDVGRDDDLGFAVDVFGVIVVKFVAGDDLTDDGGEGFVVAEN